MPDPIQVEQSFRELMEQLESTISIRHRYRLFRNFIDNLEDSFLKFESYILQLVDELPEFSEPLTWTGMDPAELELYLAMLDSLNTELQLSEKSQKYSGICNRLREICILLYGCLNDLNGVNFHIKKTLGMSGLSDTDVTGDAQGLDMLRDWISAKLQHPEEIPKNSQEQLKRILNKINEIQSKEQWRSLVPVAEKYSQYGNFGRLRKIFVERYSETDEGDELVWNTHLYGAENPSVNEKKIF